MTTTSATPTPPILTPTTAAIGFSDGACISQYGGGGNGMPSIMGKAVAAEAGSGGVIYTDASLHDRVLWFAHYIAAIGKEDVADAGADDADAAAQVKLPTNNVAEYDGAILACQYALQVGIRRFELRMDSQLAVRQFAGQYKCKNARLQALLGQLRAVVKGFEAFTLVWIKRDENQEADWLSKLAVKERRSFATTTCQPHFFPQHFPAAAAAAAQ